jgi:D-glycero-D-manno-heptose 1,7-bisphosphate phosphatase
MSKRAVFLDRDGVLIEDVDLIARPEQVRICDGALEAINELNQMSLVVVVVSNQTVVSRGITTEQNVQSLNTHIQDLLHQKGGAVIDRFYTCLHHPNATLPEYRVDCACRKPRPGLLVQAAADLDIDLKASYMVGDRISDILAGHSAGCTTVLVQTGKHTEPPIESPAMDLTIQPDKICPDLQEAARWIVNRMT